MLTKPSEKRTDRSINHDLERWNGMSELPQWWKGLAKELQEDIENNALQSKQELIQATNLHSNQ
jgi:hypothetical protein